MFWIIFWVIVLMYLTIAIKRMPVYFKRYDEHNRKTWPSLYKQPEAHKEAAWVAMGWALGWLFYECGRWVQNHIIHTMTADERRKKEFEKAEKIVAEYAARKEREEREAFDRELHGHG